MSFKVENMEEKNMVKLVIETTAEEFEAGLNTAFNKNKNKSFMVQRFSMKMQLMPSFLMLMLRQQMKVN